MASPSRKTAPEVDTSLIAGNIKIHKRRTSVRLEPAMWTALYEVAAIEGISIHDICTMVDEGRAADASFSSSLRVFLLKYYRNAARSAQRQMHAAPKRASDEGSARRRLSREPATARR